jgi:hypothetical protein
MKTQSQLLIKKRQENKGGREERVGSGIRAA